MYGNPISPLSQETIIYLLRFKVLEKYENLNINQIPFPPGVHSAAPNVLIFASVIHEVTRHLPLHIGILQPSSRQRHQKNKPS